MAKRKRKEKEKQKKKHWRKEKAVHIAFQYTKERDGYKCQCCGSEIDLTVHHLYAGANFPSLRADPVNLVCMCNRCHTEYHRIFNGYSNHKMIVPDTFIVWLRMNQYYMNGEGKSVENKLVTELISEILKRQKYLLMLANQDIHKKHAKGCNA